MRWFRMLTIFNIVTFLITWNFLSATWVVLRCNALKKSFKASEYTSFLDFFEYEYLGRPKTWRRSFSWVYNSKVYIYLNVLYIIVAYLLAIGGIMLLVILNSHGFHELLMQSY